MKVLSGSSTRKIAPNTIPTTARSIRPALEQPREDTGPEPRVQVVDVGRQEVRVAPDLLRGGGLAEQETYHVGVAFRVASARAEADPVHGHGRLPPPVVGQRGEQRRSGGG